MNKAKDTLRCLYYAGMFFFYIILGLTFIGSFILFWMENT